MKPFLLDIWHDLAEKRLWPVALGLVVALVAVPLVVAKPASEQAVEPAQPQAPKAQTSVQELLPIDAVDKGPATTSDLSTFETKDPFRPLKKLASVDKSTGTGTTIALPPSSTSTSGVTGSSDGGSSSSGAGSTEPSTQPAPKTTPKPESKPKPKTKTVLYTYVIDVEFGKTGAESLRKGIKRLEILPDDRNPMLVFLGVTADRKKAVFLVDSRLSQSGEGACKPSVETCNFLYLRTDGDKNEHFLTTEAGDEYTLRLVRIRRVKAKTAAKESAAAEKSARANGEETSPNPLRLADPFKFNLFSDEES